MQVLARELGYGQEVLSHINMEFDEFLNTSDSPSQSSGDEGEV